MSNLMHETAPTPRRAGSFGRSVADPISSFASRPPAPQLRPYVDRYVGYRMLGFPPGLHRGLPSRHHTFIVSIGDAISVVEQTNTSQTPADYRCVLSGLQASAATIAHDGNQEGVAIELTPLGCRTLFGLPARELWDLSVELSDVVGNVGQELWERLQHTTSWTERFAICDDVLSTMAHDQQVSSALQTSWRKLVTAGGDISIRETRSNEVQP